MGALGRRIDFGKILEVEPRRLLRRLNIEYVKDNVFSWVAFMKYYRLVVSTTEIYFLTVLELEVCYQLAGMVGCGLQTAVFLLCPHMAGRERVLWCLFLQGH